MKPTVYLDAARRGRKAPRIAEAFAKGCGGQVVSGAVEPLPGPAVFYGITPGTEAVYAAATARGDFYYIDNGYFRPGERGYLRVTRDAEQHDGLAGDPDHGRLAALNEAPRPWRRTGEYILVCAQTDYWYDRHGIANWIDPTVTALRAVTDRPLRIRLKRHNVIRLGARLGARRAAEIADFAADLDAAWAVVAHSSNALVRAVMYGVPIFATGACAALAMGLGDLTRIEDPAYPSIDERRAWAARLAANQWTKREIADGTCWRALG